MGARGDGCGGYEGRKARQLSAGLQQHAPQVAVVIDDVRI